MGWLVPGAFAFVGLLSFFTAWAVNASLKRLRESHRLHRNDGSPSMVEAFLTISFWASVICGMVSGFMMIWMKQ